MKLPSIPSSVLKENECRSITATCSSPEQKRKRTSTETAAHQSVKSSTIQPTHITNVTPKTGSVSAFVDRSTPFDFTYQSSTDCFGPGGLSYPNPYGFLPPISHFNHQIDSNSYRSLAWSQIPPQCPPVSSHYLPMKSSAEDVVTLSSDTTQSDATNGHQLAPIYSSVKSSKSTMTPCTDLVSIHMVHVLGICANFGIFHKTTMNLSNLPSLALTNGIFLVITAAVVRGHTCYTF